MKTRQEKANEIRDLVTRINGRIAELKEDGFTICLKYEEYSSIQYTKGLIKGVTVKKIVKL